MKDEVENAYKKEIIMELQSNEVDDMQTNLDAVAQRLKQLV